MSSLPVHAGHPAYDRLSGVQVTVYDDEHMGDFIGMVVHFTNEESEHAQGGVRSATFTIM